MFMAAIVVEHLGKQYPNGKGIHGISFAVETGELFGFLGPNGAGKSTAIRTIMGFLTPTSGSASVLGHDVVRQSLAVRRAVGYLPSDITLYDYLTGEENIGFALKVRGQLQHVGRAQELARRLEVDLRQRIRTLSRGQKQKVAIVTALAHDPDVIIMDEPTTGLDPLAQEIFHSLLRAELGRGKTIFMSSHILSEVESLCRRVAIIRDGRIITQDTVAALKKQRVKRVAVEFQGAVPALTALNGVTELKLDGHRAQFTYQGPPDQLLSVLAGQPVVDITLQDPSLEEIFMAFYAEQEVAAR
jgi:ABC-2 type transport system ATP-binding protein